jgi:hypothetical protein
MMRAEAAYLTCLIGSCACPCCGRGVPSDRALEMVQGLHEVTGQVFRVNSCCRCVEHNRQVGGSPKSTHLIDERGESNAFDLEPVDRYEGVYEDLAIAAVYDVDLARGVGMYPNHLHIDCRPWSSSSWVALPKRNADGKRYWVYMAWSF